jgi:hypothetical protein
MKNPLSLPGRTISAHNNTPRNQKATLLEVIRDMIKSWQNASLRQSGTIVAGPVFLDQANTKGLQPLFGAAQESGIGP